VVFAFDDILVTYWKKKKRDEGFVEVGSRGKI
jgi:hypothetical protein